MLFNTFTMTVAPNSLPRWNGIANKYLGVGVQATVVSLKVSTGSEYAYIDLDLWVHESDPETRALSGTLLSTKTLSVKEKATIILSSLDDLEGDLEDYTLLKEDKLGSVLQSLISNTEWNLRFDASKVYNFPVITETEPLITLNGSVIDKIGQLLAMFNPSNLWGQGLSYMINPFTKEILIVAPLHGDADLLSIEVDDAKIEDLTVKVSNVDLPEKIIISEDSSSLYRHESHFTGFGVKTETYEFKPEATITEKDTDETEISALIRGERFMVGNLLLSEEKLSELNQVTASKIGAKWGGPGNSFLKEFSYLWVTDRTTSLKEVIDCEYILGPPYNATEYIGPNSVNKGISNSLPGTRQQISRDLGSVKINKDNYPSILASTDGIRLVKRTRTTTEYSQTTRSFSGTGIDSLNYPPMKGESPTVETNTEELYIYDDDGILIGERSKKTTNTGSANEVTESVRLLTPISKELTSEVSYTQKIKYNYDGSVGDSTITDVSATVTQSELGPDIKASASSAEDNNNLREEVYKALTPYSIPIEGAGRETIVSPKGVAYVSVFGLTIEELKDYLNNYFQTNPRNMWVLAFSSRFLNIQGVLGGHVHLSATTQKNSRNVVNLVNGVNWGDIDSGLLDTMGATPFRVTGINMHWEEDKAPEMSVACCQLI